MLARQPVIWRRACVKLWGSECVPTSYGGSWRYMFITRPHPHFHGVYISECSYVRQGEASLDCYYPPFHTVVYYRYLRFYSDGRVLYFTSPDDPALCVSKMKGHGNYQSLLGGHFTISEVDGEKRVWTSSSQSNIDYISIAFSSGPCPLLPTIFTLWQ